MTITPAKTPDGRDGFRITCDCATHTTGNAAIVAFPIRKAVVHGHVTMAHEPSKVMQMLNARKGVWVA